MIHQEEIDDQTMEEFKKFVEDHIRKHKDNSVKVTGDRVLLWDTSRLTEVDSGEINTDPLDHHLLTMYPSIVIEDNVRFNQPIILGDRHYDCNLDLIVWNKTIGKVFRTNSEFVKITEKKA